METARKAEEDLVVLHRLEDDARRLYLMSQSALKKKTDSNDGATVEQQEGDDEADGRALLRRSYGNDAPTAGVPRGHSPGV